MGKGNPPDRKRFGAFKMKIIFVTKATLNQVER